MKPNGYMLAAVSDARVEATAADVRRWAVVFAAALAVLIGFTFAAKFPLYRGVPPDTITDNRLRTENPIGKDYWHYFVAAEAMKQGQDIYDSGIEYYIYPPLPAMLFIPLTPLGWMLGSQVFLVLSLAMVLGAAWLLQRDLAARLQTPLNAKTILGVMCLSYALVCEPARRTFSMIQTDPIILLCLAAALVMRRERPLACGALLGLAVNIKYHVIIMLPYFLLRRQWKAAAAFVVSALAWAMAPALVVGWERNLGYWRRALGELGFAAGVKSESQSGTYPLTWEGSISIPSAVARGVEKLGLGGSSGTALVGGAVIALAGAVALVVWWMYRRQGFGLFARRDEADTGAGGRGLEALEWAGLMTATVVFSPQTTKRHMLVLMVLGALAATMLISPRRGVGQGWLLAGVGAVIAGMYLPPRVDGLRWASDAWNASSAVSWCVLGLLLVVVWKTLKTVRAVERGEVVV